MSVEFLSPKTDIIFKLLFGDERSVELLTDFLKSVLRIPADEYDEVTIVDPHLLREYKGDKLGILDVKNQNKIQKDCEYRNSSQANGRDEGADNLLDFQDGNGTDKRRESIPKSQTDNQHNNHGLCLDNRQSKIPSPFCTVRPRQLRGIF